MKKLWMLSFANIRKTKGLTISLLTIFIIGASLLNVGLLVFLNYSNAFDETVKELNTSDNYYMMPSSAYTDEVNSYIENNENVLKMEKEESIVVNASVQYGGAATDGVYSFHDISEERNMTNWEFVGEHLPPDGQSIYLPYIYKVDGGYELNDQFVMNIGDEKLTFTVKGFTEDVYFSSIETGVLGVYVPHETYQYLEQKITDPSSYWTTVFTDLDKINDEVETGITNIVYASSPGAPVHSLDLTLTILARTVMANLVSAIIIAFAGIIFIVCLLVVWFRIGNSIEDDMEKIGSLKAIGYTSKQVIYSIVMQFSSIALLGCIVGIGLSYLVIPPFSNALAHQSGINWDQGFDASISAITLVVILFSVIIISFLASRRINKLNPIVALRGGIVTHNFKKNYLPLDKTKGKLSIIFGFKSMFHNLKQSIMIMVVTIAITISGVYAIIMFYNATIDTTAYKEVPGFELCNVSAELNSETDPLTFLAEVEKMPEVRKAQYLDEITVEIEKNGLDLLVMDDFSNKETDSVYEGRYPEHANEIAISGILCDRLGKGIGDSIIVEMGEIKQEFIITGLTQGSLMFGSVTTDGAKRLVPDFKQKNLQIYLKDDVDTATFAKEMEESQNESLEAVVNMDQAIEDGISAYTDISANVSLVIIVATAFVILLVLYFIISSTIARKKRELGIQKAIGFTTFQLMNQLAISLMPPVIIGTIIGVFIGVTQTNTIMSVVMRSVGIMEANYIIVPSWCIVFGIMFILFAYVTSLLISYQIRKISAYALVTG